MWRIFLDTTNVISTVHLTVCSCHVTYMFQRESTFHSCLNVKELLPWRMCETGQMIELCCEYLSVWCIWQYVLVTSRMHFRVNSHYSCLNVKELLAGSRHKIWSLSGCIQATIELTSLWNNAYVTWQEHTVKCTIQISAHNTAQSFGQCG